MTADAQPAVVGLIPVLGREAVVGATLGRRTLLDLAVDLAAQRCDVVHVVDATASARDLTSWTAAARRIVIHDPLCPLTPIAFIDDLLRRTEHALVAVRPVVDTVKAMRGDVVARTVDRDRVRSVASPIVVGPEAFAAVAALLAAASDPARLVDALRGVAEVTLVDAPPQARRISDVEDLPALTAAYCAG